MSWIINLAEVPYTRSTDLKENRMSKRVTFLQLAQEFGGTRFGPFSGVEVRLGSDPSKSDISLPEALGVAPEHLKLLIQTDGSYILAPIDRTASVFFYRSTSTRSKQVNAPMAIQSGDGFSLVTADGPRFYVQTVEQASKIKEAERESEGPASKRPRGLTGGGLAKEIKRVGLAKVLTSTAGRYANNAWTFAKTGQMFAPRYVVMGMMLFSGWLFAGGASCTALSFNQSKGRTMSDLTNCRDQLGISEDDGAGPTVPGLTRKILIDREWQTTVEADKDLYEAYAENLRVIFADPERYKWVYSRKSGSFARFKAALESKGLPPNLVRVLAYSAAMPGFGTEPEWSVVEDSDSEEVCGRGPMGLTYAQGYRLGLSNLQLDAMVERSVASSNDIDAQVLALETTASRIDAPTQFDRDLMKSAGASLQGGVECLFVDGNDDRINVNALAGQIAFHLGTRTARGVPRESESHWIAARLTRLYAMDFRRGYEELDFDARQAPSVAMTLQQIKKSRVEYSVNAAAAVIARAVAVPCLATLDKEISDAPPSFMGDLPNLGNCAIVKAFVEYDRL